MSRAAATTKRAGLTVEFRPIGSLVPYAHNARTHTPHQVAQLRGLMVEYGWTNPVLADAHGIIAGHGRVLAAEGLYADGATIRLPGGEVLPPGTVPVIDCTGWSDAQRRAYIIADNKSALLAGWDEDTLATELSKLQADHYDVSLLGFTSAELAAYCDPDTITPGSSDEQPPLDRRALVTCPECGHAFHPA